MQGKYLIIKMLDLLVEMSEHCMNRDKLKHKCKYCELSWKFGLSSCGCFLVETIENNSKFIENLESVCLSNNIDYKEKLNKIEDIFIE